MPIAWRLRGKIQTAALSRALSFIVKRHESLRTLIVENDKGRPTGILVDSFDQPDFLIIHDLSAVCESDPLNGSDAADRLTREIANTPFKLDADIPFRANLILLNEKDGILVLTLHHQAGDGASWNIIGRELKIAYAAFSQGTSPELEALPIQYSDWAHWQEASLKKKLAVKLRNAKERLSDIPERLTLPCDYPRHTDRNHRADYVSISLPAPTVQKLEALARSARTTVFAVLVAIYGATLSRIAGQSTVAIGSPISGRTRTETEQLVGFFLNTLVIPLAVDPVITATELIQRAKTQLEAAFIDQDLPFELLVEEMGVARSLDHTPIFQTMLSFQNQGGSNFEFFGLEVEQIQIGQATTKFDLTLVLTPAANGDLSGVMEYDADLFEENNVKNWASSFMQLATAVANAPERPLIELEMLTPLARANVINESKGASVNLSNQVADLASQFALQVHQTPASEALLFEQDQQWAHLSFAELDTRSNQLARHLLALGVGTDQVVAVLLDRSPQMIIAMLAILKAGAAYLPLDPDLPISRLRFMLKDSQTQILLTSSARPELLNVGVAAEQELGSPADSLRPSLRVLDLNDAATLELVAALAASAISQAERSQPLLAEHLAYLIYTSGSTGTPKGAGNTHQAVVNRLLWMQEVMNLGGQDRVLQKTAIGFDVAVWEWF